MNQFLTKQQRKELLNELRLERYAKYSDRIKTILLLDQGKTYREIAEFLFISERTIGNYRKSYEEGGIEQLVMDDHDGGVSFLKEEQLANLKQHLTQKLYRTAAEIRNYIEETCKVKYSVGGLRHLLKRLGFVYKKPKLIPGKASKAQQEEFIKKLEELRNSENPLYFADGVHPQHNTYCEYGWIQKGKDFELLSNTGRSRININGAINAANPEDVIINEAEFINAQSTIELLKSIESKNPTAKKINVIVDNARYYKCNLVTGFLQTSRINLVFLPPYSPNLNLIERLWRVMNRFILYNKYYEKFADFKKAILGFFENISLYKLDIQKVMNFRFHLVGF